MIFKLVNTWLFVILLIHENVFIYPIQYPAEKLAASRNPYDWLPALEEQNPVSDSYSSAP